MTEIQPFKNIQINNETFGHRCRPLEAEHPTRWQNRFLSRWASEDHIHTIINSTWRILFSTSLPIPFSRVFGNPAGDPVLLKSRGVTLLRDTFQPLKGTTSNSVFYKGVSSGSQTCQFVHIMYGREKVSLWRTFHLFFFIHVRSCRMRTLTSFRLLIVSS